MLLTSDLLTRRLYATDASMYETLPQAVAFPKTVEEIQALVLEARQRGTSITARAAGTSLAGQTTGQGIVMDAGRFMTSIAPINEAERSVWVEPGVIRDSLNREAAKKGLLFGPDTATTNRCMLGGMIGNNSSGSFSIKYGTTREHVQELKCVLNDGSVMHVRPLSAQELEEKKQLSTREGEIYRGILHLLEKHRTLIERSYPQAAIPRRNTGYALDMLLRQQPFSPDGPPFNLCALLCGSEGTLALTAQAKVNLEPLPPHTAVVVSHFSSLDEAMRATVHMVKHAVSAVELVDDIILNATKGNIEQRQNRFFLQGEPACILVTQFDDAEQSLLEQRIAAFLEDVHHKHIGYAHPVLRNRDEIRRVWDLRKAGLGLLMGLGKDAKSPTFVEDTAVRVEDLLAYISDFKSILKKHNTDCVYYAHASVGELHLRPMINIQTSSGVETMKAIAQEVADLVARYRGSLSGEHGDGKARSPYIGAVLGNAMLPVLEEVKRLFDPTGVFNPGIIVTPKPMEEGLRYEQDRAPLQVPTVFRWEGEEGFQSALEQCNGAGVCRKLPESGGTMCPSYQATRDEKDSTRGRANVFRQVYFSRNPQEHDKHDLKTALDLCLSCKACKSECPANVDMARMKAEFSNAWHQEHGISVRTWFFARPDWLYPLASRFAAISNWFIQSPVGKELLQTFLGIHKNRTLPLFSEHSFRNNGSVKQSKQTAKSVGVLIDYFSAYHEPEVIRAAEQVLEKLGYEVHLLGPINLGRTLISKGLVDQCKTMLPGILSELDRYDMPIIGLEPSELLTVRDEYLSLCDMQDLEKAKKVAQRCYLFEEFVHQQKDHHPRIPALTMHTTSVLLHNHCHSKALVGNAALKSLFEWAGCSVEVPDNGCCGMAGSFGYEQEHYEVSMAVGHLRTFGSVQRSTAQMIVAPGFSCRHQIADGTGKKAVHPAIALNTLLV